MNTAQIGIVFRKELTDTLRDRRTLIWSVLMPVLMFPLLILAIIGLGIYVVSKAVRENPQVMILGEQHAPELSALLRKNEHLAIVPATDDYAARINDKKLRAAVEFPAGFEENLRAHPDLLQTVKIYWFEGEVRSQSITRVLTRAISEYSDKVVVQRLSARGLSGKWLTPFQAQKTNVAPPEKVSGNILGFVLPYFVIILCLTGAMYPAIDLTAGEKERGTMETILASPVHRVELVLGKFLLVLLTSLVTTVLALLSMAVTVLGGAQMLARVTSEFALTVSGKAAVAVFFLVLPLAILFSAALLAISVFARNYREAQTYIGPLMLIVILPAMASFLPGVELNTRLALVPILNVSLVAKEVFAGVYQWPIIGLIFGSTLVYAAVALYLAVRQFHREDVLFRT